MTRIFILAGQSCFEDRYTWVVGAFLTRGSAQARMELAEARVREIHAEVDRRRRLPRAQQFGLPALDTSSAHDPGLIYRESVDYSIVETELQ